MLNVNDTLEAIPQMNETQLEALEELVESDSTLDDDEKDQLLDAIDEAWGEEPGDVDIDIDEEDDE